MGNVIPSGDLERNIVKPLGDGLDGVRKCAHLSDVTAGVQVMAAHIDYALLGGAVVAAFAGAYLGKQFLTSVTMGGIRVIVACMLFLVALGLATGVLR